MIVRGAWIGVVTACLLAQAAVAPCAEEWGNLSGRFVYDGPPPKPAAVNVPADAGGFCLGMNLVDESLVVGKDAGLANVIVFLRPKQGQNVPVHPDYKKTEKDKVVLDNLGCRFAPHVVALRTTQTLKLTNSDPLPHNTKVDPRENAAANPLVQPNAFEELKLSINEDVPIPVSCSIHSWMNGWVIVRDNPYFAVTDANGKFEIKDIPAGDYEFQLWQERAGYLQATKVGGKQVEIPKGRLARKIAKGDNDLGEMKIDPEVFKPKD